jgi:hypothetical protein
MEEGLIINRETIEIEGGRKLYNYTFRESTPSDRLLAMIEAGELGVIGPFLDSHAGLYLAEFLRVARERGNEEAVREIEARL